MARVTSSHFRQCGKHISFFHRFSNSQASRMITECRVRSQRATPKTNRASYLSIAATSPASSKVLLAHIISPHEKNVSDLLFVRLFPCRSHAPSNSKFRFLVFQHHKINNNRRAAGTGCRISFHPPHAINCFASRVNVPVVSRA